MSKYAESIGLFISIVAEYLLNMLFNRLNRIGYIPTMMNYEIGLI